MSFDPITAIAAYTPIARAAARLVERFVDLLSRPDDVTDLDVEELEKLSQEFEGAMAGFKAARDELRDLIEQKKAEAREAESRGGGDADPQPGAGG